MGDPQYNLTELSTTLQYTTKLHTAQRLGGALQGCVQFS